MGALRKIKRFFIKATPEDAEKEAYMDRIEKHERLDRQQAKIREKYSRKAEKKAHKIKLRKEAEKARRKAEIEKVRRDERYNVLGYDKKPKKSRRRTPKEYTEGGGVYGIADDYFGFGIRPAKRKKKGYSPFIEW